MNCLDAIDLVPEALEETLAESALRDFQDHLDRCAACRTYVEQLRLSVEALRRVPKSGIPNPRRAEILEEFRKKFR